ncbi:MAG: hypothetical protein K2N58_11185 [Treponemataceae bacterium]|nr:hypothetical protein [Treponemataceae bacterium]
MIVVSDTTPLISLLKIGRLDLLRTLFKVSILDRAFRLNHITAEETRRCAEALRVNGRYISGELLDSLLTQMR